MFAQQQDQEADSCAVKKPKFHNRVYNSQLLVRILSEMNPVNALNYDDDDDNNNSSSTTSSKKAVPLHAMEAFGGRGGIAPTHSRPRH
jgi:hypothetical protein